MEPQAMTMQATPTDPALVSSICASRDRMGPMYWGQSLDEVPRL